MKVASADPTRSKPDYSIRGMFYLRIIYFLYRNLIRSFINNCFYNITPIPKGSLPAFFDFLQMQDSQE
ncbi:hypothetical protein RSJ42_12900 [Methanosarcina hadiensis]|uniref:hypothetical protein n=1 Tax=Methanosarcina hadiensis TaxID=3078083 RepID=UPI0039774835